LYGVLVKKFAPKKKGLGWGGGAPVGGMEEPYWLKINVIH